MAAAPGVGQLAHRFPPLVQAVVPASITHPYSMARVPCLAPWPKARALACRRRAL
jgi:hypothetical protein